MSTFPIFTLLLKCRLRFCLSGLVFCFSFVPVSAFSSLSLCLYLFLLFFRLFYVLLVSLKQLECPIFLFMYIFSIITI